MKRMVGLMAFFSHVATIKTRLSPEEVERRLKRIVRKPRTMREVLQHVPPHPPEHPSFVGLIDKGHFKLNRLADVPSSVGWFQSERPSFQGFITPTSDGCEMKITFSDLGLSCLVIGMIMGVTLVTLAVTRGVPLMRIEHAIMVFVIVIGLGAIRYSLHQDVEASLALIHTCLKMAK